MALCFKSFPYYSTGLIFMKLNRNNEDQGMFGIQLSELLQTSTLVVFLQDLNSVWKWVLKDQKQHGRLRLYEKLILVILAFSAHGRLVWSLCVRFCPSDVARPK